MYIIYIYVRVYIYICIFKAVTVTFISVLQTEGSFPRKFIWSFPPHNQENLPNIVLY